MLRVRSTECQDAGCGRTKIRRLFFLQTRRSVKDQEEAEEARAPDAGSDARACASPVRASMGWPRCFCRLSMAARINAAKSGCGARGLDLNSGWNWQPTNHG